MSCGSYISEWRAKEWGIASLTELYDLELTYPARTWDKYIIPGYNPRRWKERSEAIAAWSSFPGNPAGADREQISLHEFKMWELLTDVEVCEHYFANAINRAGRVVDIMISNRRLQSISSCMRTLRFKETTHLERRLITRKVIARLKHWWDKYTQVT